MNILMNQSQSPTNTPISVKDRVFSNIEKNSVEPTACYVFWCKNSGMWMIWLLTVLLGALATAVLLFTSSYRYYEFYEAMYSSVATFVIDALPWLWLLTLVLLTMIAARGLRLTRRGYRLSPWFVGGSSVGVSVVLGLFAHAAGFGFVIDNYLGDSSPMYYSQAERERNQWQSSASGRLLGNIVATSSVDAEARFIDSTGQIWTIQTQELPAADIELLSSGIPVRLIGMQIEGAQEPVFHVCGVFAWHLDKHRPMEELSAERSAYVAKMAMHREMAASATADGDEPYMCAHSAAALRLQTLR